MSICVPEAANQLSLHLESNEKKRMFYMIRSRIDYQGNLHEENRTTFHKPEWLKLSDKKWVQKRDHFVKKFSKHMNEAIRETNGNIKRVELL
jgi:hypothetical protein